MITITIEGDPVPWSAPKLSRGHVYDPKEREKQAIRYLIKQQYNEEPIQGYVCLCFFFVFSPPKSASKKKREAMLCGSIMPTRADCTNLQKLYEDCLKNVVFGDDRNVMLVHSEKAYQEKPKTIINIWSFENAT